MAENPARTCCTVKGYVCSPSASDTSPESGNISPRQDSSLLTGDTKSGYDSSCLGFQSKQMVKIQALSAAWPSGWGCLPGKSSSTQLFITQV